MTTVRKALYPFLTCPQCFCAVAEASYSDHAATHPPERSEGPQTGLLTKNAARELLPDVAPPPAGWRDSLPKGER